MHVLRRDRKCVIAILVEDRHWLRWSEVNYCEDASGQPIFRWSIEVLEFNHVKPWSMMGGPRPASIRWGVAACHRHNAVDYAVSKYVDLIRKHLAQLEEEGRL